MIEAISNKSMSLFSLFFIFDKHNKSNILKERYFSKMKLYTEEEIRSFMKNKDIVLDGEYIEINDSKVNRDVLIKSLKQLQMKNMNERENFNEYKNGNGQKNRNKIRKCK